MSGSLTPNTPLFVKTHDFLVWLLRHTQRFPKNLRHSYMLRLETVAFEFQKALLMGNAVRGAERSRWLGRADGKLVCLRALLRFACDVYWLIRGGLTKPLDRMNGSNSVPFMNHNSSGVVMTVVIKAMKTNMQKTLSVMTPKSLPTLITISSIKPRVFIIAPIQSASRVENPPSLAAMLQPPSFPKIAQPSTASRNSQCVPDSSVPMLVRSPV